jgi:conjugal transfer pilus assembly protein TraF
MVNNMRALLLAPFIASFLLAANSQSLTKDPQVKLDDGYGDSFLSYKPYIVTGKEPTKDKAKPAAPVASKQPEKKETAVDVKWLQENSQIFLERAVNDPSDKNIEAHLYVQRVTMDKAQRFSEAVAKKVIEDPVLNENNRIPYASSGAQEVRNADYRAQQQAVRELAEKGGLVVFVDSTCRFCAMQLPVTNMLKNEFQMESLVVSLDGSRPKGYSGHMVMDNGLYRKLDLKLTPSIVYVPHPKGYQGEIDPNTYLVLAQGYYAADELVKQIAYAGHNTKLLSKSTMNDLSVWDRGVASTEDLKKLKLDPNKPETFKQKLQPMLLKQYKTE